MENVQPVAGDTCANCGVSFLWRLWRDVNMASETIAMWVRFSSRGSRSRTTPGCLSNNQRTAVNSLKELPSMIGEVLLHPLVPGFLKSCTRRAGRKVLDMQNLHPMRRLVTA
eukprot:3025258-Pyramimonas_sp.AAC.1